MEWEIKPSEVYVDGGVIWSNPSPIGGVWAWCAVRQGTRIRSRYGFSPNTDTLTYTCNLAELEAAIRALEALPYKWHGKFYSDSNVTLQRLFEHSAVRGVPKEWIARGNRALRRLGYIEPVLLQGHPTKVELQAGIGRKGLPVSEFNVWCDDACNKAKVGVDGETEARSVRGSRSRLPGNADRRGRDLLDPESHSSEEGQGTADGTLEPDAHA